LGLNHKSIALVGIMKNFSVEQEHHISELSYSINKESYPEELKTDPEKIIPPHGARPPTAEQQSIVRNTLCEL
jgi:hypothetical protein